MRERARQTGRFLFPTEEERIRHLHWLAFLRVTITTFIAGSLLLISLPSPITLFYTIIAANILVNLLITFFVGRGKNLSAWTYFSIYWDIVFVTLLVYLSGGLESPFVFLYFLSLIYAGVVLSARAALVSAAFCFLIYGLLLTAQSAELLPTFSYEPDSAFYPKATPKEVLFAVLTNGIGFFITAILSSLVAEQIRKTSFKLKEKERELEQYKARFDDIVRTVQIGLITVDNDERITYINPTAERILERSLHEIRGQPIANLLPIPDGEGIDEEVEYTAPSGTRRYLAIASQVLTSSDGHREGRVVSIRDQTEIKRMQQEVMRTEKLAAIGRLTASIAHEIRNPLTSISGCIELLQQEVANGETSQHLMNIIAEEIDRLNQLISDILYLAKPPKSIESVFDISNMLYDLAYAVSTDPSCRDRIKVETELTSGLYVRGDPSQLRQMFWNIIINSVQAIRGKGRILIRSSILQNDSGRQAKVSIEDTGIGIPPDVIDSIFDPFFTTKEKGTGLGLTIAHKIVESHEGKIRVDSEPDKGTVFTITIPMVSSLQVEG